MASRGGEGLGGSQDTLQLLPVTVPSTRQRPFLVLSPSIESSMVSVMCADEHASWDALQLLEGCKCLEPLWPYVAVDGAGKGEGQFMLMQLKFLVSLGK